MTLAAQVAEALRVGRDLGLPFDDTWARAVRALPRATPDMDPGAAAELAEWRQAIRWAKPYYRAAFHYERLVADAEAPATSAAA